MEIYEWLNGLDNLSEEELDHSLAVWLETEEYPVFLTSDEVSYVWETWPFAIVKEMTYQDWVNIRDNPDES